METMLTAVHQAQVGYQCCRGSRWNMPGPMKRPPPYFDEAKEYTLEEIGLNFDVTRERIRQIEAKALRRLRHPSRSAPLRSYYDE